jgi:hypothetical protein
MADLRYNVFGRIVAIRREGPVWRAFTVGADGKRSPAGFEVPDFLEEGEIEQFLFDLFHELAVNGGDVQRLA